jgi:hypothetical protein
MLQQKVLWFISTQAMKSIFLSDESAERWGSKTGERLISICFRPFRGLKNKFVFKALGDFT